MLKAIVWLMLLSLLAAAAAAQTYRCRTAGGLLVFTDDPGKAPSGCRQVSASAEPKGAASFVPMAPPAIGLPAPHEVLAGLEEESEAGEKPEPTLMEEAAALAEEYHQAVARRVSSLPPVQVQKARIRVLEIQRFRDDLLRRVAKAPLPAAEKAEIERILESIPATQPSAGKTETEQLYREKGTNLVGEKLGRKIREWKAESQTLAAEYREIFSERSNPPVAERLQEIRRRKYELLDEIKGAHLDPEDRAEIETNMDLIPPPL